MTLNHREHAFVNSVLDCMLAATPDQLQRGPRVAFWDEGERGIDAGGLSREMYAQFAAQTLEADPSERLFKMTAANRLQPEPCAFTRDPSCGTMFRGYGRLCGMALCTGGRVVTFSFCGPFPAQSPMCRRGRYGLIKKVRPIRTGQLDLCRVLPPRSPPRG